MGFEDLLRTGIGLADSLTSSLQVPVTHRPLVTHGAEQNRHGEANVKREATVSAIVIHRQRRVQTETGEERVSNTSLMIPRAITVTTRDQFELRGEDLGPVLAIAGVADPIGGRFYTEVFFG